MGNATIDFEGGLRGLCSQWIVVVVAVFQRGRAQMDDGIVSDELAVECYT